MNSNQKSIRFRHDEAGFLLLDAVAFAIFLSMLAGALGLYQHAARIRREVELKTAAIYIANSQISNIRSKLASGENVSSGIDYLGESEDLERRGIQFRVLSKIEMASEIPDQIAENFRKIKVEVFCENWSVEFEEIVRKN